MHTSAWFLDREIHQLVFLTDFFLCHPTVVIVKHVHSYSYHKNFIYIRGILEGVTRAQRIGIKDREE